jgi:beta-N-acetylhexosaminidase
VILKRIVAGLLFSCLLLNLVLPVSQVQAAPNPNTLSADEKARQLLEQMTPEEKVGQLFLVSFNGADTSENSQIYDLITNEHIGGVVLLRENDNFSSSDTNISDTYSLIAGLQTIGWNSIMEEHASGEQTSSYVPLFVAISQEGDSAPYDQIFNGLTPLSNEMAIGATWKTASAEETGKVLGQELSAIGFNMLLGPSLDVTDSVRVVDSEDLGVRVFGGNPYWVAKMGKAFIFGVHEGSNNQMAVIARNFPGRGDADRTAEDEVATVRKSMEQLQQVELAPFESVTSPNTDIEQQVDGLLVSHIRYEGIQGNISANTRPISMDSTALNQLLTLPEFSEWRNSGGIMVSDDLSTTSIQKFYDPNGTSFDARQVVKNAFMAGNDLLYMGNLTSSGDEDNYTTIINCLKLFVQKYREDASFAQQVDDSVFRLLTQKYEQYDNFTLAGVVPNEESLLTVGTNSQVTFEIAKSAVTLISPNASELDGVLRTPPQLTDRIVFISDLVMEKQCSSCMATPIFSADEFRNAVINLYGLNASGQIQDFQLSAYNFNDVKNLLEQTGDTDKLTDDLSAATWVVFSFLGDDESAIGEQVLRRFLSERSSMLSNKHVIGFAFTAPYYLDATDISKLSAYYGIYGKTAPFVDVAARVLFQEIIPEGKLPVSVAGVAYDLTTALKPDPDQVIQLMVDESLTVSTGEPAQITTVSSTTTPAIYRSGDTLSVKTGVIVDTNGNPVQDGTVVRFMIDTGSSSGTLETKETSTNDGVARTDYRIPSTGFLEITVQSDPALFSQTLHLSISDKGGVLTALEPTIIPTDNGSTETVSPTASILTTVTQITHAEGYPTPGDWLLSTVIIVGLSALLFWMGSIRINLKWAVRWSVVACMGGYLAYLYLAAGLPGTANFIATSGTVGIAFISAVGVLIGWAISGIWWLIKK